MFSLFQLSDTVYTPSCSLCSICQTQCTLHHVLTVPVQVKKLCLSNCARWKFKAIYIYIWALVTGFSLFKLPCQEQLSRSSLTLQFSPTHSSELLLKPFSLLLPTLIEMYNPLTATGSCTCSCTFGFVVVLLMTSLLVIIWGGGGD